MAITRRASLPANEIFTTANPSIPFPTGLAVGDLIVIYLAIIGAATSATADDAGWTQAEFSSNIGITYIFWKVATSAEVTAGAESFTLDTSTFRISYKAMAFTGATFGDSTVNNQGFVNAWAGSSAAVSGAGAFLYAVVETNQGSDVIAADAAMTEIDLTTDISLQEQTSGISPSSTGARGGAITSGFTPGITTMMFVIESAGGGGGTNTPMTLNATETQTPTRDRATSRPRSVNQAQTASMTKGQGFFKTLTGTITQTMTRVRSVGRTRTTTQTQTTGTAPVLSNAINSTANQTQTPTRIRALSPAAKTATETQTPSATKGQGFFKTLTGTITQTASRLRGLGLPRSATQTQVPVRLASLARTLLATQAHTASVSKSLAKGLSVTESQVAALARSGARLLALTTTQTPVYFKPLARPISALSTQTLVRTRALARALNLAEAQTPSANVQQSGGGAQLRTITANITQTASLLRVITRALPVTSAQTASQTRALPTSKTATSNQTPSVVKGQGFFKTLTGTITQTASRLRGLGLPRSTTQNQTPAIGPKQYAIGRSAVDAQTTSIAKTFAKTSQATETQAPSLVKGQGYFKTLTITISQTASRILSGGKAILATQAQTPSRARSVAITQSTVETQAAVRARAISRFIATTSTQQPTSQASGGAHQNATLNGFQFQAGSVRRGIGAKGFFALHTQLPSMTYVINRGGGLVTSITIDPNTLPARATIRIILP